MYIMQLLNGLNSQITSVFYRTDETRVFSLCAAFRKLPDVALHFHQTSVMFDW